MKYVRTKDELGIYIEYDGEYKDLNEGTYFKTWRGFRIHEDWKVADTIEELCDEFISVRDNWHDHWLDFEDVKILCSESEIYGAIWTDKGLIYVAKMNDKGELELL